MKLFGYSSGEEMPAAYIASYKAWDAYMGRVWHGFFRHAGLPCTGTVIEVAPGSSIKIGLALAQLGFKGTLYLVDPCAAALNKTCANYRDLLPEAAIIGLDAPLASCLGVLPEHAHALAANHPLDDMILAAGTDIEARAGLFGWTAFDDERVMPLLRQSWRLLAESTARLRVAEDAVLDEWRVALRKIRPQTCVISQYASSALASHGMQALNVRAKMLIRTLRAEFSSTVLATAIIQKVLQGHKNYDNLHIGREVLAAENWLVLTQP